MVILLIKKIIINNICATTVLCVHSSGAWTGRNLILDEALAEWHTNINNYVLILNVNIKYIISSPRYVCLIHGDVGCTDW